MTDDSAPDWLNAEQAKQRIACGSTVFRHLRAGGWLTGRRGPHGRTEYERGQVERIAAIYEDVQRGRHTVRPTELRFALFKAGIEPETSVFRPLTGKRRRRGEAA